MATTRPTAKTLPDLRALVDEIGDLELEISPFRFKIARYEDLRRRLRIAYEDHDAGSAFTASGDRFDITVGPRSNEKVVDIPKLIKAIGIKVFSSIASVSIRLLESECSYEVMDAVVRISQTGSRSLRVLAKGKAAG